jgi:hypothetical protein
MDLKMDNQNKRTPSQNYKNIFISSLFLIKSTFSFAQFTYLPNPLGSEKAAKSRIVNGIVIDNNNNLYITTHWNEEYDHDQSSSIGLYTYINGNWKSKKIFPGPQSWEDFARIKISPDGSKIAFAATLITPTSWRNILSFDISNPEKLQPIKTPVGISSVYTDVNFDNENNLWFSMDFGRYNGQNVKLCQDLGKELNCYNENQTSEIKTFCFYGDTKILMDTGRGYINTLDTENPKREVFKDLVSYSNPSVPISSTGEVYYIGEYAKLGMVVNGNKSQVSLPVDTNVICALVASNGKVFLGTQDGLLIYDNGKCTILNTDNSNIKGNRITALAEDSHGQIWLAGVEEGVFYVYVARL